MGPERGERNRLFLAGVLAVAVAASAGCSNGAKPPSGALSPAANPSGAPVTGPAQGNTGTGGLRVVAGPRLIDAQTGGPRSRVLHTANRLSDGRVIVLGGIRPDPAGAGYELDVDFFDEAHNSVTTVTATAATNANSIMSAPGQLGNQNFVPVARYGHTATMLTSGKLAIVGGVGWDRVQGGQPVQEALGSMHLFDSTTNQFTLLSAKLATPRYLHSAILLGNDNVLISGGFDDSGAAVPTNELIDFSKNPPTVTPNGTGPRGLAWGASAPMTGGAIVWGGMDDNTVPFDDPNNPTIIEAGLSIVGQQVTPIGFIPFQVTSSFDSWAIGAGFCMYKQNLFFGGGLTLVVVGGNSVDFGPTSEGFLISDTQGTFGSAGGFAMPRAFAAAAVLKTDYILVAGGHDATNLQNGQTGVPAVMVTDSEISDGTQFMGQVKMIQPRACAAAVSLRSGKVAVIGGSANATDFLSSDGTPTETIEIYEKQ